jgi:hypothetical protein
VVDSREAGVAVAAAAAAVVEAEAGAGSRWNRFNGLKFIGGDPENRESLTHPGLMEG